MSAFQAKPRNNQQGWKIQLHCPRATCVVQSLQLGFVYPFAVLGCASTGGCRPGKIYLVNDEHG